MADKVWQAFAGLLLGAFADFLLESVGVKSNYAKIAGTVIGALA